MTVVDGKPTGRRTYRYFLEAVLLALLVLGPAVAIALAFDLERGNVAEWIAGLGTVAAVIAAVFAARYAKHARDIEMARDEERDLAQRRHQAEQVAVWAPTGVDWEGPLVTHHFPGTGPPTRTEQGVIEPTSAPVTIHNESPLPIFGLDVEIYIGKVHVATHSHAPPVVGTVEGVEVITATTRSALVAHIATLPDAATSPAPIMLGWSFRDLVGRTWRWIPLEGLREIPDRSA